jgi:hypothetical protein
VIFPSALTSYLIGAGVIVLVLLITVLALAHAAH